MVEGGEDAWVDQPPEDGAALDYDMDAVELYLCTAPFDSLAQIRADRRKIQLEFNRSTERADDDKGAEEASDAAEAEKGHGGDATSPKAAARHGPVPAGTIDKDDEEDLRVANLEETLLGAAYRALFDITADITPEDALEQCLALPRERARLFGHRSGHYQVDGSCFGCQQPLDEIVPLAVMKQTGRGAGGRASFDRAYQRRRQIEHVNH
jgi:hypothetical protein